MRKGHVLPVWLLVMCCTFPAVAKDTADVSFHGTLIEPPPCTINNGDKVDVDFGDKVGVSKVDGVNYRIPVNYQVTCTGENLNQWGLVLTLSGMPTGFDKEAIQTSVHDLGIKVYQGQGNTVLVPGTPIKITLDNQPRLEAVPVKRAGSILPEGAFEATATLRAEYQ